MNGTATIGTESQAPRKGKKDHAPRRSSLFARTNQPLRVLGFVVVSASVLMSLISFLILSDTTNTEPSTAVWTIIWIVTGLLVLLMIALVVTEAMLLLQARLQKQAGANMQIQMVTMFALVAAIPAVIVAVVASISLNQGLDQWFSERTRSMVESSRLVARSYMLEHAQVLRDDVIWVASELEQAHGTYEQDRDRFQRILTALAVTRSLPVYLTRQRAGGKPDARADRRAGRLSAIARGDHPGAGGRHSGRHRARTDQSRGLGDQAARL